MFINREELKKTKIKYPKGTKIKLVLMEDIQAPSKGTLGVVKGVDDTGSLLVQWETGSTLNVLYGEDIVEIIREEPKIEKWENAKKFKHITGVIEIKELKNKILKEEKLCEKELKFILENFEEFLKEMNWKEFYILNTDEREDEFCIKETDSEIDDVRNNLEDEYLLGGINYLIRNITELNDMLEYWKEE